MNTSDIRTRVDALDERSRLVTRTAKPEETPTLTLVETPQRSDIIMRDPLIQALVDKLPKPNTVWSLDDRARWLRAAAIIFNLVYSDDEHQDQEPRSKHKDEEKVATPSAVSGSHSAAPKTA